MGEDEIATCTTDAELVVAEDRLACVPRLQDGPRCPAESVGVPPLCKRVREGRGLALAVWMQSTLDGLCPAIQVSPLALRGGPVEVSVVLRVPGNDLSLSSIEVVGADATAGLWMRLLAPYLDALRAFGGQATTAVAEARVRCTTRTLLPRPEPMDVVGDP